MTKKTYLLLLSLVMTNSSSSSPSKSGKQQQLVVVRCQVEGCDVDLTDAKAYYSRHKVCGVHSKTPVVVVAGLHQRFCQQCSRFHLLPEFDKGKRSCRRRLAGHNERRRKPSSGSLLSTRYGSVSSPIFENNHRAGGFMMDFSAYPRLSERVQWPNARASERAINNIPTEIPKLPPDSWKSNADSLPSGCLQDSLNRNLFLNQNVPSGGYYTGLSESSCALSLLSNQTPGSRNQPSSLGENFYVNPDGAHMTQPVITEDGPMDHFSSTLWPFKDTVLNWMDPQLGQMPQSVGGNYGGLDLALQSGRECMEVEHSRIYDSSAHHVHWSL